jgi:hypothetical protein
LNALRASHNPQAVHHPAARIQPQFDQARMWMIGPKAPEIGHDLVFRDLDPLGFVQATADHAISVAILPTIPSKTRSILADSSGNSLSCEKNHLVW